PLAMITPNVLDNPRRVVKVKHETLAKTEPANARLNTVQKCRFFVNGTIQFDGFRSQRGDKVCGRAFAHYFSRRHDSDAVAKTLRFIHIVGRDKHRLSPRP